MQKAHSNINWENFPSISTPINEQNLNKMDNAIDTIDDRVIALDTSKFNLSDAQSLIKNVTFDLQTGILKKYYYNGSTEEINTGISKLNMNLRFDKENQILYILNADGTEDPVDLSVFITNYEFKDSDTIAHNVSSDGTVTSIVKDGSIKEKHLQPNYLADIKVETAKSESSANAAEQSAEDAEYFAKMAESQNHGGTGVRDGEDTDNSKYWSEQSKQHLDDTVQAGIDAVGNIGDAESDALDNISQAEKNSLDAINNALDMAKPEFLVSLENGHLYFTGGRFLFKVNKSNGHLEVNLTV